MQAMDKLKQLIAGLGAAYHEEITAIRRHIHSHPELSCEEFETAKFICSKLDEYGIPFQSGIAGTGVVALIAGHDSASDCIALRADMDALPIVEENDVPYKSQRPGVMHACGHDAHVACLLGAARILQNCRDHFSGTVKLIFQPSEEQYPGGAITMIGEGVLENPAPRVIIAQHVINTLEAGSVGFKPGFYMASTDEIFINVRGKGGHAATPAQVVDPVLVASHIVIALQQIVSRRADPVMPTVVSIGKIAGEGRTNIIPDEVKMAGTVRTYDEAWRLEVHRKIEKIAKGVAESMDATCEVRIDRGYPGLFNDPGLTASMEIWAKEYLGEDCVIELPQRMTAEDFAWFAQKLPGCLFRLGIGSQAKGIGSNLHSPTFDIDETSLKTGAGLLAWFAVNLLRQED
jgi:amidohydrolase